MTVQLNPYEAPAESNTPVTVSGPARCAHSPTTDPLFQFGERVSFGKVWPSCRISLYRDRLELRFLTTTFELPVNKIQALRSAGKGFRRHLLIVHDDPKVPETVKTIPHYPAKWYEAFESLGIATEDDVDLRASKQYLFRSEEWIANLEGGFWICVLIVAPVVIAICKFVADFFA